MIEADFDSFIHALNHAGWQVQLKEEREVSLPPEITSRYPTVPDEYMEFLKRFHRCTNKDSTAWFNCEEDYYNQDENSFGWNFWERVIVKAAEESGDAEWKQSIVNFWDQHFPIMGSVKSDYAYLAICTAGVNCGSVMYGFEDFFEEPSEMCSSFGELVRLMTEILMEKIDPNTLGDSLVFLRDFV